jgi:ABC-type branched-subunit amino acid transport system substrate-binding protein
MPYKAKAAIIVPAAGLILGACSSSGGSQTATTNANAQPSLVLRKESQRGKFMTFRRHGFATVSVALFAMLASVLVTVGTSGSASAATGKGTVTIGVDCEYTAGDVDYFPDCKQIVLAMAAEANASGGENGYKIQVVSCDPDTIPASDNCASQLVTLDHADVIVGPDGLTENAILKAANVAEVAPIDNIPAQYNFVNSFPAWAWSTGTYLGLLNYLGPAKAAAHGCILYANNVNGLALANSIQQSYDSEGQGGSKVKLIPIPEPATSFTSQVAVAKADNCNPVFILTTVQDISDFVQESHALGWDPRFVVNSESFEQDIFSDYPAHTSGLYFAMGYKPFSQVGQKFTTIMNKYGPGKGKWAWSYWGINDYVGMDMIFKVLDGMSGPATPKAILTGMQKGTFTNEFLPTSLTWTKKPAGAVGREYNRLGYIYALKNGKFQLITPKAISFTAKAKS